MRADRQGDAALTLLLRTDELLAVCKPAGLPSQPDPSGDADALTLASARFAGGERLYPVHRLDRTVGGVLLFARTARAAATLSALFAGHRLCKEYEAIVEGELSADGEYRDLLYKDSLAARARVATAPRPDAREAVLTYRPQGQALLGRQTLTRVRVSLLTGRFHQIRAQFSAHGHPLLGDRKYGAHAMGIAQPALFSSRLAFSFQGEDYEVRANPPMQQLPWQLFANMGEGKGEQ